MTEIAVIALGNFWELQDELARLPGVLETAVGYAGGTLARPSYHAKGDHLESLKIVFDPRQISYEDVLRHALTFNYGPEGEGVIFYVDEHERQTAEMVCDDLQQRGEITASISLEPLTQFHTAEDYHQNMVERLRGGRKVT